jgi:hypothetical protein
VYPKDVFARRGHTFAALFGEEIGGRTYAAIFQGLELFSLSNNIICTFLKGK